jgi:type VI secretion system protein VasD
MTTLSTAVTALRRSGQSRSAASGRGPGPRHGRPVGAWLGFVVLMTVVALAGGCGGAKMPEIKIPEPEPPPPPTRLVLDISASSRLNPNPNGNPAPLVVRIYELAETGRFTGTGFHPLYQDDRGALGSDMVGREELRLRPGARQTLEKTLNPGTGAIGVLAAYRNLDGVRWRATVPVLPETDNRLTLTLNAGELNLAPTE